MSDKTLNKILFHALEHFSKYGYSGSSVREITHACQVTKPTLYYYFKNKDELYYQLAQTTFAKILAMVAETKKTSQGSWKEKTKILISNYLQFARDEYVSMRFAHITAVSPDRAAPDVGIEKFADEIILCFSELVEEGVKVGDVKEQNKNALAFGLRGALFLALAGIIRESPRNYEEESKRAVDLLLNCP